MYYIISLFFSVIVLSSEASAQEEIILFPEDATVILGENGTFHCNSRIATTLWELTTNGSLTPVDTERALRSQNNLQDLAEDGIYISVTRGEDDEYNSSLIITGNATKNLTQIQCALATGSPSFDNSPTAILRVIGPPTLVTDLDAAPLGDGVEFLWSPSFSPFSAPITYHVTVWDSEIGEILDTSNTDLTTVIYTPPQGFCSILQVSVSASNRAGMTEESTANYTLLTRPDADVVISSFSHGIALSEGEITVHINISASPGCSVFPVTQYELLLDEITPDESYNITLGPSTLPTFTLNASQVRENAAYKYRVRAINALGLGDETDYKEFTLTDVQMPVAIVTSNSVTIICNFIPGSVSRGCYVRIMTGNMLQSRSIERPSGADFVEKTIEFTDGIDSQQELAISVFDWEEDNSMGSLLLDVDIIDMRGTTKGEGVVTPPSSVPVPPTDGGLTEGFQYLTVTIAVSATALVVALLIPLVTVSCCVVYKCRHKAAKEQSPATDKVLCSTVDFPPPVTGPLPYEVYPPQRSNTVDLGSEPNRPVLTRQAYSHLDHLCKGCDESQSCLYSQLNYSMSSLPSGSAVVMNPLTHHHPMAIVNYPMGTNSLGPPVRHVSHDLRYSPHPEPRDYAILENIRTRSCSRSPRPPYHLPSLPPDYSEIDALQNRPPSPTQSISTTV